MDEWQSASTSNIVLIIILILVAVGIIAIIVAVSASSGTTNSTSSSTNEAEDDAEDDNDEDDDDVFDNASPRPPAPIQNANQNINQNTNLPPRVCTGNCQGGLSVLNNLNTNSTAPVNNNAPEIPSYEEVVIDSQNQSVEIRESSTEVFDLNDLSEDNHPHEDHSDEIVLEQRPTDISSGEYVDIDELAQMELASVEEYDISYSPGNSPVSAAKSDNSTPGSPVVSSDDSYRPVLSDDTGRSFNLSSNDEQELNIHNPAWESFTFNSSKVSDLSVASPKRVKNKPVAVPTKDHRPPLLPRPAAPPSFKAAPYVPPVTGKITKQNDTSGLSFDSFSNPASFSSDFSSMTEKSDRPVPTKSQRPVQPPSIKNSDIHVKSNRKGPVGNLFGGKPPRMGPL